MRKKESDQSPDKMIKIAEIMGLLEEKGKTKDWLLEELRKNKAKLSVSPTTNSFEILKSCKDEIIVKILKILKDDEFNVKEINTLTKTLHWFFTDIVGSSNPNLPVKIQARKIMVLNLQIKKCETFKKRDKENVIILPTGDGTAIGFNKSPEEPLRLAIELHKLLNKYNKTQKEKDQLQLRIGIDSGPIYFIKDVIDNDSVWGPGIIMARRVMDLCGDNQIFVSQRIGNDISNLSPEYKAIMHKIGDYTIKHGEQLLIYNVYGKGFGNKIAPKKGKVIKENKINKLPGPTFEFNSVELHLDVTDPKTMMTHHTWIWDVKNINSDPLEQVFYDIGGDVAKDFSELNVKITDENDEKLEIISLDVNRGHIKQFNVKLKKPIRKKQKGRILKLEYDWEEPERVFEYIFSAKCKKFKYKFTIPKDVATKNRILEVVRELGIKKRAEPPAKIDFLKKKTQIIWESDPKKTIERHGTYEFQW